MIHKTKTSWLYVWSGSISNMQDIQVEGKILFLPNFQKPFGLFWQNFVLHL